MKPRKWMVELVCWAYFALFAYAAFDKLFARDKFIITMGQSGMLTPYAGWLAWMVPLVEIVLALMLVLNFYRLFALYASFGLMSLFTAYIFIVLYVMEKELCGCGAVIEALGWFWHLVFNIVFMALAVAGIILHAVISRACPDPSGEAKRREISPIVEMTSWVSSRAQRGN